MADRRFCKPLSGPQPRFLPEGRLSLQKYLARSVPVAGAGRELKGRRGVHQAQGR
ncbi:hypothetical protein Ga0061067_11150 [Pannonibacter indicus]|uniref:Uncharacterized protein n=1 Tax=Pannonibacter indicus TaxID=466044 RepID=A0A0K6I717_9HYPH|nr:hypothetical protein Ga0061067_11150 [Pannonibacter indicus]